LVISIIILKDYDLLSAIFYILYTAIQIKVGWSVSQSVSQSVSLQENSELFLKFYGNFLKAFWVDL